MLNDFFKKSLFFYSLGNLFFIKQWLLIFENPSSFLFEGISAQKASFLSIWILTLVFAFVFFCIYYTFSKIHFSNFFFSIFLFLYIAFVLNSFRVSRVIPRTQTLWGVAVSLLIVGYFLFKTRSSRKVLDGIGFLMLPFAFLVLIRGISAYSWVPLEHSTKTLTPTVHNSKTFYFLFDMWDYHLALEEKKAKMFMPYLQELKKTITSGSQVYPPASWTPLSISSSLYGTSVQEIVPQLNKGGFSIKTCNQGTVRNHDLVSLFEELKNQGKKVGVVGWHLPYCQLFGQDLDYCYRFSLFHRLKMPFETELIPSLKNQLIELSWIKNAQPQRFQWNYEKYMELTQKLIKDPSYDFVFIHYSFPHPPFRYDSEEKKWKTQTPKTLDYWDNLELVDETLKKIKTWMSEENIWDTSSVLFTSDHSIYRTKLNKEHHRILVDSRNQQFEMPEGGKFDFRIPFLLKFPGQKKAAQFSQTYNALLNKELILSMMNRKINSHQELGSWIQEKSSQIETAQNCFSNYEAPEELP